MYYDFNIPYPSNQTKEELERVEKILERIHSSKISSFYDYKKTLIKLYKDQKSIIALNVSSKTGILDVKVRI